jgi:ankyrin repeat protein
MKFCFRFLLYFAVAVGFSPALAGAYEDFFKAIELDRPQSVRQLLERGFDPNSPSPEGQVALFIALRDGAPQVAEVLLASPRLNVDASNAVGETPLMMAALRGELAWVQRLVERGAQVNRSGWTPLHYAASGPEVSVLSYLLDRGAAIDALAPNGSTALMMAARYGAVDAAPLLLKRGANPSLRNNAGLSAADFARGAERDALATRLDALIR